MHGFGRCSGFVSAIKLRKDKSNAVIVSRFGLNPVKEVEQTLQRFRNNGVEIKGAIFNAVEKKASAYGYGNYGYYQYEYKSDGK